MYKNEATRAKELNRIFLNSQFKIEDIVEPEYPIVALHSNSTIFYGNDAFCELSQYSHDEIIGLNAWRLFSPESTEIIAQKLKEGATGPYLVIAIAKNGTAVKIEIKGKDLEFGNDKARAVFARIISS